MTVFDDIVGALQASPLTRAVYLTSNALGPVGSSGRAQPNDLQNDANAHAIYWDSAEDVLAVDTREQRNGKIASLRDFLARRSGLWLTAVNIVDPENSVEQVTRSVAVAQLLVLGAKQRRFARRLWCAAAVAVLGVALAYYYCCCYSTTTAKAANYDRLPQLPPPLFLSRRRK